MSAASLSRSARPTKRSASSRARKTARHGSLRVLALGVAWLVLATHVWSPFGLGVSMLAALAALACEFSLACSRKRDAAQLAAALFSVGAWTVAIAVSAFYAAGVAWFAWAA